MITNASTTSNLASTFQNEHLHEAAATNMPATESAGCTRSLDSSTDGSVLLDLDTDPVEKDIHKWEDYYDQMKSYLQSTPVEHSKLHRRFSKPSEHFSLEEDGNLYYKKAAKDGTSVSKLLVIRSYEDRLRICKAIHLNTGEDGIHFRRDPMLSIVGQHYYWKGQRRDVCECIALCEVCSAGLGAKRKSRPPRQSRDVRPPSKLLRIAGSTVAASVVNEPFSAILPPPTTFPSTLTTSSTCEHEIDLAFELSSVTANAYSPQPTDHEAVTSNSTTFPSTSFQPIFTTTIDQPIIATEASRNSPCASSLPIDIQVLSTTPRSCGASNTSSPSASGCGLQNLSDSSSIHEEEDAVSIYQSLFNLPSQPSSAIAPSVVNAMQSALTHSADPVKLREAAQSTLKHSLKLSGIGCSVLIAPSRAAAYVLAIAASMLRNDPLSINQGITSYLSSPMAVIHDACCQVSSSSSLKPCTSLVGAYNWNLGSPTSPMDRKMLAMAVRNNRVAAVFHQPFSYLEHCQYLSLQVISTVCQSHSAEVAAIVDAAGISLETDTLQRAIIAEFFENGADAVLLPETEQFSGPPHTCVLVAKEELLLEVSLPLLQAQVALPLSCTTYDMVGTVMAFMSASNIS